MPRSRSAKSNAQAITPLEISVGGPGGVAVADFLSLWLPFELQIGRLTNNASPLEPTDENLQMEERRKILERVFAAAEMGAERAKSAVAALEAVVALFASRVENIVRRGENNGEAPGQIALAQLAEESEFLKLAVAYNAALHSWLIDEIEQSERAKVSGPRRVAKLPAILRFFNDAPHAVTVRGLAHAQNWKPSDEFAYAYNQTYASAQITMGLRDGVGVHDLWAYLASGGPRLVKAHYALWARYYEDVDEGGLRYAMISIPKFCEDLGYTPHAKGGFRPEHKREALKMLEALTSIEMSVEKTLNGKVRRIRGPLWARGFEAQERDQYGDLFGANRVGNAENWEPVAFSFAPGPWFDDPEWRRYHRFVGKIGSGLLRLSGSTEKWPILIGGYLGTLMRVGAYKTLRLKVGTILKNLDLAQGKDAERRVAQTREKLMRALDRLAEPEIGIIHAWRIDKTPEPVEPDMDDPDALTDYGQSECYPAGDWREWVVEIEVPFENDAARLKLQRAKAIQNARKTKAPTKKVSE